MGENPEKGIAILDQIHDGTIGNFTGPELVRLAGHYPAGYTHIEEHINTLKYRHHQRIIKGEQRWDFLELVALGTFGTGVSGVATIEPPAVADGDDSGASYMKNDPGYHTFSEVSQQVLASMKAAGKKAFNIHRTMHRTDFV